MKRSNELLDRIQSMNESTRKLLTFLCTGIGILIVVIAWTYLISFNIQTIGDARARASAAIAPMPPPPNGLSESLSPSAGLLASFRSIQTFVTQKFSDAPASISSSAGPLVKTSKVPMVDLLSRWSAAVDTKINGVIDIFTARFARTSGESDY